METLDFLKHWSKKESPDEALARLEDRFKIKIKKYDDRVTLNYDQINSPKMETIVRECRGLILSYPDFDVLCRSFDRFFNYGEGFETLDFPFEQSIIYEKLDGSLTHLYYDNKVWGVSSRSMAFAEGPTSYGSNTFRDVFCKAVRCEDKDLNGLFEDVLKDYQGFTWIFEMTSPETRVVKSYPDTAVYLTAVRDKISGRFIAPESMVHVFTDAGIPVRLPQVFDLSSLEDLMEVMKGFNAVDEGFVCYHAQTGRRVKVKNPAYLAIAHMRDNGMINPGRIIALVTMNETDEYFAYFPDDKEYFIPYQNAYRKLIYEAEVLWEKTKDIERQKEFALAVKDSPISAILFRLRKNMERNTDQTIAEIINTFAEKQKEKLIERFLEL